MEQNSITLEDLLKDAPSTTSQPEIVPVDGEKRDLQLTEEEKKEVEQIKNSIDLRDGNQLLGFGNAAQSDISGFSETVLETVRVKDGGHIGELLANLVGEVEQMDESSVKRSLRKIPLVGKLVGGTEKLVRDYDKLSVAVSKIATELDASKMAIMKDIALFDGLYQKNYSYFRKLELYIEAGEQKLREIHETILPRLRQEAAESSNMMAAQALNDFETSVSRFEKRVEDLKISRIIAIQTAPQIRLIQNNDRVLVERVNSAIHSTIPLWKSQIVIALGLSHQERVLQIQQKVSETTNNLLKKNAELLRLNAVGTAKENERAIVDIDTLKKVNEDLVATISETMRIQREGRQKRIEAEKQLLAIESNLKKALKENSSAETIKNITPEPGKLEP